jgi:hypothetical protein
MDKNREQLLNEAKKHLETAQEFLNNANYERAAVNVTLAYRKVEPFGTTMPGTADFEDSLIEIDHAPGADTTDSEKWIGFGGAFTKETVVGQIRFLEGMIHRLEQS